MIGPRKRQSLRLGAALAVTTVILDQLSKFYLLRALRLPGERSPVVIAPFLDLSFVWNHGISYGLFQQDSEFGRWILVGLSVAAVCAIGVWLSRTQSRMTGVALGLIAGGALGNALDRALYGAVIDFLHLHGGAVPWLDFPYSFNLADAAISLGVVLLLAESVFSKAFSGEAASGLPESDREGSRKETLESSRKPG
ncbi:MAG: signal peptidase II [Hyphomicrobiales bacterium]